MNRTQLQAYIAETYHTDPDYPWTQYPSYAVFRHQSNQKWFALVMDVSKLKLGLQENQALDVVNLKCDPILIGALRSEPGIFPAYHMSRTNWITVALDGSVSDERLKLLLDMSFELTAPRTKKRPAQR